MRESSATTRQRIAARLREGPATPSALASEFAITTESALSHVEHVSRSTEGTDGRLLVSPPTCRECGFSAFDDPLNVPSRCPDCKAESVEEPAFLIE
ncbi:transcriptional regulator [Halalkalicoccus jeotgali]|uniref:Predicted transcriptional regulator containing an HTH domain fused to a Zn-ribbon n=1 Tax=Halalkalicoccus jeotgali (strain DSM 18796 / CECT 7217 / JCM 14584 / KCTC 4019 / B3) TaxID=795797 RepID=D8J6W4_HALJB|nr:transcriptional regulator [Halalkalicoccus jeotgali]ADJ15917.1 predicted transcriptional regulator containing an HTH domain fused to a Zn-ribbon [Halalkalicoccus jeotgali B3]ELY38013.1 putative transcriptional regulator containing an HTH domain fused to a Zn-ribbon [Halalkalicoccus jeotgali B3]